MKLATSFVLKKLIFLFIVFYGISFTVNGKTISDKDSATIEQPSIKSFEKIDTNISSNSELYRSIELYKESGVLLQDVSSTFGVSPIINIRGKAIYPYSVKPIWIVDGIIIEDLIDIPLSELSSGDVYTLLSSSIASFNPTDIESIQILKDGTAIALYGIRAAGGAIVVTTKKGTESAPKINYVGGFTIRLKPNYKNYNVMNSVEQVDFLEEMKSKGFLNFGTYARLRNHGAYNHMFTLMNTYDEVTGITTLPNTPDAEREYIKTMALRNTDWFDELYQNTLLQSHSISLSGSTSKSRYYASLGGLFDPGWIKQSNVNRYTINMNLSHNLLDNLSFDIASNVSYRKQKAPGTLNRSIGINGEDIRYFEINPYYFALNTSRTMDSESFYRRNYAQFNIHNELENNYMDLNELNLRMQAQINWEIIKGLSLHLGGTFQHASAKLEHHVKDNSNLAMAYRAMDSPYLREINPYLFEDPENPYGLPYSILPEGGFFEQTNYSMSSYNIRGYLQWNPFVKMGKHSLDILFGLEMMERKREQNWHTAWGVLYEYGKQAGYTDGFLKAWTTYNQKYYQFGNDKLRNAGFFSSVTYSYLNRYELNLSWRYDGYSSFKTYGSEWTPFYMIKGIWNIHKERFFKNTINPQIISHLSISSSYSSLFYDKGNDKSSEIITYSGSNTFMISTFQNKNEEQRDFNLSTEMGFLKSRINFMAKWYKRKDVDLMGYLQTHGPGSVDYRFTNVADVNSRGLELGLHTINIYKSNFRWDSHFLFTLNNNNVVSSKANNKIQDLIGMTNNFVLKEEYPTDALFSIPFAGLDENGFPTFYDRYGNKTHEVYLNGYSIDNLIYEGRKTPPYFGSFENTFQYKNWKLNVFLLYAFGHKVRLQPLVKASYDDFSSVSTELNNRWIFPGDESETNIPTIATKYQLDYNSELEYAYLAYNYSTERIAKGDFFQIKDISLSYDFPKKWFNNKISKLSLEARASNLFLVFFDTRMEGQDPYYVSSGGVSSPMAKQFTFTIKLEL